MAVTPETTFLSTFQTMECSDSCPHTHTFTKCVSQLQIITTIKHCDEQQGKLSSISLDQTLCLRLDWKVNVLSDFNMTFKTKHDTAR